MYASENLYPSQTIEGMYIRYAPHKFSAELEQQLELDKPTKNEKQQAMREIKLFYYLYNNVFCNEVGTELGITTEKLERMNRITLKSLWNEFLYINGLELIADG